MAATVTNDQKRRAITEHYDSLTVPYGTMIINHHDPLLAGNLQENVSEIKELMQFCKGIVIDVGANVGSHTINFARVADIVYAFEPQPRTYYNLCANLLLNLVYNVVPLNRAIGSYNGLTNVANLDPTKPNTPMGVTVGNGAQVVPMCTIDSLELSPVHFIKIDTEGHEFEVLRGAEETLKRESIITYVEIHKKELIEPIKEFMIALGHIAQEYLTVFCPDPDHPGTDLWLTTGYLFYKEGRITWVEP